MEILRRQLDLQDKLRSEVRLEIYLEVVSRWVVLKLQGWVISLKERARGVRVSLEELQLLEIR